MKSVRGSVNTLGSRYAITIKQNINRTMFGLVKKQTCISKNTSCSIQGPPRHKRFNIKFVFKLRAEKLSFSLQTSSTSYLFFFKTNLCFWSLPAHHVNSAHWDGTLIHWLEMSLEEKWTRCGRRLHVWDQSTDCKWRSGMWSQGDFSWGQYLISHDPQHRVKQYVRK